MSLDSEKCEACRGDVPKVSDDELKELMREIPEWTPTTRDGVMMLQREYKFKNFRQALAFTNRVGELAEEEKHHPEITTEWGKQPSPGGRTLTVCIATILLWRQKPIKSLMRN